MTELLRGKRFDTGEIVEFTNPEPLPGAVQFMRLSDALWAQNSHDHLGTFSDVQSHENPLEVRSLLNNVVGPIDERFVVSGIRKALGLGRPHPSEPEVVILGQEMDDVIDASVGTFNWDDRLTHRRIDIDGEMKPVELLDGHRDYLRELHLRLRLANYATLTYAMQRAEYMQDETTSLSLTVWHPEFAETGYEGHMLAYVPLSQSQESQVLDVMRHTSGLEV